MLSKVSHLIKSFTDFPSDKLQMTTQKYRKEKNFLILNIAEPVKDVDYIIFHKL